MFEKGVKRYNKLERILNPFARTLRKQAKRLALFKKKKKRVFQCLFSFKLRFQSRLVLASKTIDLSKKIVKVKRKPRRKVH